MKNFLISLLILSIFVFSCGDDSTDPDENNNNDDKTAEQLLPADNEISGWDRSGDTKTAKNADELTEIIDGEAQIYLDRGFKEAAFQDYQGTLESQTVKLEVAIFDQTNEQNAYNVYEYIDHLEAATWGECGKASRYTQGFSSCWVEFYKDRFYVRVTIMSKTDAALSVAKMFALNIANKIPD